MTGMFNTHPLELHEIRSKIGTQLDIEELASRARVSRDWNDSFTPLLYNSVTLTSFGPSVESLRNNKHLVQHLTVHGSANVELFHIQGLDRLTTVRFADFLDFYRDIGFDERSFIGRYASEMTASRFLQNNSRVLRSIDISRGRYCEEFWNNVATCGALKEIKMAGDDLLVYDPSSFVAFMKSWSQLDSLSLHLPRMIKAAEFEKLTEKLSTKDMPWRSTVKHFTNLSTYISVEYVPWWPILGRWFPGLECLNVGYLRDTTNVEALCRVMEAGTWKNLHSLSLASPSALDSHLIKIIDSMVDIQRLSLDIPRLSLGNGDLGPAVFAKLERHFLTLRELEISASSAHLVAVLENCPLLEVFKGSKVFARDFTPGRQWPSSSRLRSFTLALELDCLPTGEPSEDRSIQRESVYRLLSHLVKVENLDLDSIRLQRQKRTYRWLDFSLESGLPDLHGLKELQSVRLPQCQTFDRSDALWMVRHWKCLSLIVGDLFVPFLELMEIREVFIARGVAVGLFPSFGIE